MDLGEVLLVLHIVGAGTWLGANIIQAVAPAAAARQGPAVAAGWYRIASGLSKKVYTPAAVLLVVTGVWMVIRSDVYEFGTFFVTIGFGMIAIGAVLGIYVFDPGAKWAADLIESGDESKIKIATSRLAVFGTVDTLLLLFTISAMVLRLS